MKLKCLLVAALTCVLWSPAFAQSTPDADAPKARIRFGPLQLNPTIGLTNLGVDNNVFNEGDVNHPKSDFTTTVTPAADARLRFGRSWLSASVKEDLVYYQKFATERSVNGTYKALLFVPLNRLSLKTGADYLNVRDRPGFEIDARSLHSEAGYHGAAEIRAFGKTFVSVNARRSTVAFDREAVFNDAKLQTELNRTMTSGGITVRHQLTPVTSVTLDVARQADRFEFATGRDSDSTSVTAGVKFATRISGSASFGYRDFQPLDPKVRDYQGAIASVDVGFAPLGSTRIGVQAVRDLQYSYDVAQPYYVGTGTGLYVTQGLFGPISGTVRVGRQQLAYRGLIGVTVPLPDRTDVVHSFGGGVAYRLGGDMRVGFNVDQQERTSDLAGRSYGGLRFGTSVTYGF